MIKEPSKVDFFIQLLQEFKDVEILDLKDDDISSNHLELLKKRLEKIKNNQTSFKSWETIKKHKKYLKKHTKTLFKI